jgi:hypothetical protein
VHAFTELPLEFWHVYAGFSKKVVKQSYDFPQGCGSKIKENICVGTLT